MPHTAPGTAAPRRDPRDRAGRAGRADRATASATRQGLAAAAACLAVALLPAGSLPWQGQGQEHGQGQGRGQGQSQAAGRGTSAPGGPVLVGVGEPLDTPDLSGAARAAHHAIAVQEPQLHAEPTPEPTRAALTPAPAERDRPADPDHLSEATPRYTGRVVVKLADASAAADRRPELAALAVAAGTPLSVTRETATGGTLVEVGGVDPVRAAQRLAAQPGVEYAVPERRYTALTDPNDPGFAAQWNLRAIRAPQAWPYAMGAGVRVAVLDSGTATHPDIAGRYLPGYDFVSDLPTARDGNGRDPDPTDPGDWTRAGQCDPGEGAAPSSWHGLHTASVIAALTGNGIGLSGIAPHATVLPLRVLGPCGGSTTDITDAIVWAAGGSVPGVPANPTPAKIINLSLASPGRCTAMEQRAIDTARSRGALIVVAAGNSGAPVSGSAPANCRGVLVVGSSTAAGTRASHSNYGSAVALAAPGVSIWGLGNSGTAALDPTGWGTVARSGTSTATPQVSATAALVWSVAPSLTPDDVRRILRQSAAPFGAATSGLGAGVLDAAAAVALARPQPIAAPSIASLSAPGARSYGGDTVRIVGTALSGATVRVGESTASIRQSTSTSLDVVVPAGRAGSTRLTVTTAGGSASAPFFYDDRYVIRRQNPAFTPID